MIQEIVNEYMEKKEKILQTIKEIEEEYSNCESLRYGSLVEALCRNISYLSDNFRELWLGSYLGTLVFVIENEESEDDIYTTFVYYGSCTHCDTMQRILEDSDSEEEKYKQLMTVCLHLIQHMKLINIKEAR